MVCNGQKRNAPLSAIGYSHKLAGAEDPTKVFFILQMLKGYNKKGFRLDSRLSITLPILERIMSSAFQTTLSRYEAYLFRAMCAIAFFAFLRVGEMTVSGKQSTNALTIPPSNSFEIIPFMLRQSELPLGITNIIIRSDLSLSLCIDSPMGSVHFHAFENTFSNVTMLGAPLLGFTLVNLSLEMCFHVFFHLLSRNAV